MKAMSIPAAAKELHDQRLILVSGWIDLFKKFQDGTFERQDAVELQMVQDRVKDLTADANNRCL
jgi:hypothetical protein